MYWYVRSSRDFSFCLDPSKTCPPMAILVSDLLIKKKSSENACLNSKRTH
jgi:hypothetical protein